jgi:hypothetical protein
MTRSFMYAQVSNIIDLTIEGSYEVKVSDSPKQDKWIAWEEKLRVVEGFDTYDLVKTVEICLVPNVVVPKNFRVLKFILRIWPIFQ